MKNLRAIAAALLIALMGFGFAAQPAIADITPGEDELEILPVDPTPSGEWVYYLGKYYYVYSNDTYATGWLSYNGNSYWLGSDGWLRLSCWDSIDGAWHYFGADGLMARNCIIKIGGAWYCFDADGNVRTGAVVYGDAVYYFDTVNGKLYIDRWFGAGDTWYYAGKDGKMQHDTWVLVGNKYYYVNSRYQLDMSEGVIIYSGGNFYHQKADGSYSVGFAQICGKWYCFDQRGRMQFKKWVQYEGHWFYFGADGVFADYL